MNDIAELTLKIDPTSAQGAAKILDQLTGSAKGTSLATEALISSAGRLMAILGPAALTGIFISNLRAAINLQDQYVRLSEVAGTTAAAISGFDLPARLSGTSLDAVAQSIARLGRSIGEARLGDVGKQGLLAALGINANDGRDAAAIFVDVAKAATSMADQNVAAFVTSQLLGRGFSEMRPLMKEIVEQGGLNARVTTEQAEAAKKFNDELTKFNFNMEQGKINLANGLLPELNKMTPVLQEIARYSDTIWKPFIIAFQTLVILGTEVAFVFRMIGGELGVIAAQVAALARRDWKGFKLISEEWKKESQQARVDLDAFHQRIMDIGKAQKDNAYKPNDNAADFGGGSSLMSAAERRARALMEFNRTYEAQVVAAKGFAEKYAFAISVGNTLIEESRKRGDLNDEAALRALSANEEARLMVLRQSLVKQEALHKQKGELGKAAEARQAIEQVNSQVIANETILTAKITTLNAEKARSYETWRQSVFSAGEGIADSLQSNAERERRDYERRKQALEVYLAENRDQITNAHQLREQLEFNHQQRMIEIDRQATSAQRQMQIGTWQLAADLLQQFAGKSKAAAMAVLVINKALAIAQVVVNTQVAVMRAYAELGYIAGTAAAVQLEALGAIQIGLIAATGLVQAAQISSGSKGGAVGVGQISPATPAIPVDVRNNGQPQTIIIELKGEVFSRQQIRELFDKMNENTGDGGRVLIR